MGPVSISRLTFAEADSATKAAGVLRSSGIRVEAFNKDEGPDGLAVVILIRSSDADRARALLEQNACSPL